MSNRATRMAERRQTIADARQKGMNRTDARRMAFHPSADSEARQKSTRMVLVWLMDRKIKAKLAV